MNTAIPETDKSAENRIIAVLRLIAVFSVVCAHISVTTERGDALSTVVTGFIEYFRYGGVGLFYIISGYLFGYNKRPFGDFCRRKLVSLVLPWTVTGIAVWLYVNLRKVGLSGLTFAGLLRYVFGGGSYLWYMSVLSVLYLLFFAFSKYKWFRIALPLVSVLSFALYTVTYPYLYQWNSLYLNFINWALFFWGGYMLNRTGGAGALLRFCRRYAAVCIVLFAAILATLAGFNLPLNYSHPFYPFYVLLFMLFAVSVASLIRKLPQWLTKCADYTFSVYLLHMPVAGAASALGNYADNPLLTLLLPPLTLALTLLFIAAYDRVAGCFHSPGVRFSLRSLIGLR